MSSERERTLLLVADDDEVVRILVSRGLERAGYEVVTAVNGFEAVSIAIERSPALCVLDVQMPEMDGYAAIEKLRADDRTAHIPVILLTASVRERDVPRGLEAGADACMPKSFDSGELRDRVQALLERQPMASGAHQQGDASFA